MSQEPLALFPWSPQNTALAAWSPDGSRIVILKTGPPNLNRRHHLVLFTIAPDGSDLRNLVGQNSESGHLLAAGPPSREGPVDVTGCTEGRAVLNPTANPGLVADCQALLALRDILAGSAKLGWNADRPITDWEGVVVGGSPRRVHELSLANRGLWGVIPPTIGELSELRVLNLSGNSLGGVIPPELSELKHLHSLSLAYNFLCGGIPTDLSAVTSLTLLNLAGNHFEGPIPPELGGLSQLHTLNLDNNRLIGAIPAELGQLTDLWYLALGHNQLTGTIPAEFSELPSLKSLSVVYNRLTLDMPEALGDLRAKLWLKANRLTGCIPIDKVVMDREELGLRLCEQG